MSNKFEKINIHIFVKLLLGGFLVVLIGSIIILSSVPPISRDALTHHLAVPKLYLKHGGIYEIPELAFRGKYDTNKLIEDEEFISKIKNKRVLNLTLDNAWLDIQCSKYCKEVYSVGNSSFFKMASLIKDFYNVKNIKLYKNIKRPIVGRFYVKFI